MKLKDIFRPYNRIKELEKENERLQDENDSVWDMLEEIKEAEKEIHKLRLEAPKKINKIAIETSSDLIQKLIGVEINNSSISAIVDDLFRKNGDKYYGN